MGSVSSKIKENTQVQAGLPLFSTMPGAIFQDDQKKVKW